VEESEKAVLELTLLTKKVARSQALQERKLQLEQNRAADLELELDRTNSSKITLLHERTKGKSSPNPLP
jgi:hypothetical protein